MHLEGITFTEIGHTYCNKSYYAYWNKSYARKNAVCFHNLKKKKKVEYNKRETDSPVQRMN